MFHIVADSGCDIFDMKGVSFATTPLTIRTDQREFVDDASLDTKEMVEYLRSYKGRSSTACPSTEDWISSFQTSDGTVPDEIYIITLTSGLSGTYNSACVAADIYKEDHPETRIHIFDSLSVGPEMVLLAEKIISLKAEGASFREVTEKVSAYSKTTRLFFAFQSLHNLAENGRVSKLVAKAAGVLGISVCGTASSKGEIEPLGKARGDKKVISTMLQEMEKAGYRGGKVRISNSENEDLASKIRDAILTKHPNADITYYPVRGLCSFYCERGGIVIGLETTE